MRITASEPFTGPGPDPSGLQFVDGRADTDDQDVLDFYSAPGYAHSPDRRPFTTYRNRDNSVRSWYYLGEEVAVDAAGSSYQQPMWREWEVGLAESCVQLGLLNTDQARYLPFIFILRRFNVWASTCVPGTEPGTGRHAKRPAVKIGAPLRDASVDPRPGDNLPPGVGS